MDPSPEARLPTLDQIEKLLAALQTCTSFPDKVQILNAQSEVRSFLMQPSYLDDFLWGLDPECEYAIKCILALGQGNEVFLLGQEREDRYELLRQLIQDLLAIDKFYQPIGGLIGYHAVILRLLMESKQKEESTASRFLQPPAISLDGGSFACYDAIISGIDNLPALAELYPVGGAGDRLSLTDEVTSEPLPAACLHFEGYSLIEGLIRDLQGREYLYYKLYGKQLQTPVAMMTSYEKNNHQHVIALCDEAGWFGRPKELFRFFQQPGAPVLTVEGDWCMQGPFRLLKKPGGHGVIWKLAQDAEVLDWLTSLGRRKILVRQVNNPIAGVDAGLLAFTGVGFKKNKLFGFSSCNRLLKSAEGVNVLIEREREGCWEYCLTNIEYTDFAKYGIEDAPLKPGDPYSIFPSNTNILFVDIPHISKLVQRTPFPGLILNMKSQISKTNAEGEQISVKGGRLESMMQNVADVIISKHHHQLSPPDMVDQLPTYITYGDRQKTISVTKRSYQKGQPISETPEGAFRDSQKNAYRLLKEECGMVLPPEEDETVYLKRGPSVMVFYHPSLGPLNQIIRQKIRGGRIEPASELQLEIAELDMENLCLKGSLIVRADEPMGHRDSHEQIIYSSQQGKCTIKNVTIANQGINRMGSRPFWTNRIRRHEACEIFIRGNGEFVAEDVTIRGKLRVEVPAGHRVVLFMKKNVVLIHREILMKPSWRWNYQKGSRHPGEILLTREDLS